MAFPDTWALLQAQVRVGDAIPNWTAHRGLLGDAFHITGVHANAVEVTAPGASNVQRIPQRDFEAVYDVWSDYLRGTVHRPEIRDTTRFSKYTISILRWLEQRCGVPLP